MLSILIRDSITKRYRMENGGWTDEPKEAQQFASANDALLFCQHEDCGPYEIVFKAENARYDMVIFQKTPTKPQ